MSDFDSNPFADPEAGNPFADPSVQAATTRQQAPIDDYNPFADKNTTSAATNGPQSAPPRPAQSVPPPQPAVMQPTSAPPPYTPSPAQTAVNTDDLQKRQEELERKAAELQRKEQEMRSMQFSARQNNWPPLPKWCCVGPCFYQDFSVDIPLEFQRIVKLLYYLWLFHICTLFLNLIGSLTYFAISGSIENNNAGLNFGFSILWFVLFTPCSLVCWYRPVYKAFRSDSSFNFFVFFFVFFFQFIAHIIECIGIDGWGTVGWISGLNAVTKVPAAGAIMLIIGFFFTVEAVADIILLIKVHRIYRSTGASFDKARQEFASGVMKNETVQGVAAEAGSAAVRGAMTQGANRY